MKLQLYVCPICGRAALFNSNKLNLQGAVQRCLSDTSPLSWVHEVELRPADARFANRQEGELEDK